MTIDQFTKSSAPITVLVNIANPVAIKLARILLEQGSRLLLIDKLNPGKRQLLGDLLNRSDCLFMDSESTFKNIGKFKKIDYVYYFLAQLSAGSSYPEVLAESMEIDKIDHKEFIRESNRIDAYMKLTVSFEATFTLITSGYISQFLEAIPESNIQIQKYAESLVQEYVERNNVNARIVRIGELIGHDSDLASPTYTARLVREVLVRSKINVFGDGMQQNFLVHTEDAVYAVLKAAFSPEAKGKTYLAAYNHPFTSLSLAYQLLELTSEEKQVVFNEVLPDHDKVAHLKEICLAPSVLSLGWEPQIPLEQALAETVDAMATQLNVPWKPVAGVAPQPPATEKQQPVSKSFGNTSESLFALLYKKLVLEPVLFVLSFTKPRTKKKSQVQKDAKAKQIIALVVFILVFFVATPYVHAGVTIYKMGRIASVLSRDVASLESQNLKNYASELPDLMDGLISDYKAVGYYKYIPASAALYENGANALYGAKSLVESGATTLDSLAPAIAILKGFSEVSPNNPAGTVSRDYFTEIDQIMAKQTAVTQAVQDAKIGNSRIQRLNPLDFPSPVRNYVYKIKELSAGYTAAIEEVAKSYDLIPYLLGYKERRNYFLMIQNETELRSTGGWFTNYALLGIENGQVRQLIVNDIYNVDGLISGVPAPIDMQKALGVKTVKASLSNWSPEMSEVSSQVTELMKQASVSNANDVTISLTFQVVKNILSVIGGVEIENLGEVNAANLYDKVGVLHSEFVPGSQEKTKAVATFMPKFLEKMANAPAAQKQQIITVLLNAIAQRSIMVYSTNNEVRSRVLDYYDTYRKILPEQRALFAVDWNWGGNKANRYIKRSTDIIVNEVTKKATMTMLYTNESKSEGYPEGKYVNVQRVYVPQEFSYLQSSGYTKQPMFYKTSKEVPYLLGETVIAIQETKPVTLEFTMTTIPQQLSLFKQSGYEPEVVRVIVTRANNSLISEQLLREQEFVLEGDKWVKTIVRNEDVIVRLTE